MIFEFLKMKDKVLDIGIGTGLSVIDFHALGLDVYGLDYSNRMLEVCSQKNIAVDLKLFDNGSFYFCHTLKFF